jgi:hypothetical protein
MTGSPDGDHLHWVHTKAGWVAGEKLVENLWLRMTSSSPKLGGKQQALETAAFHALDSGSQGDDP